MFGNIDLKICDIRQNMERNNMIIAFGAAVTAFMLIMILSPFMYGSGTIVGLDGVPGSVDNTWSLTTVQYALGDIFCHQEMSRSFVFNGNQMPFCIRDTGIFVGLSAGLIASVLYDKKAGRTVACIGLALICVTAIEWLAESCIGDMPNIRFVSGICAGLGASMLVRCYIDRLY